MASELTADGLELIQEKLKRKIWAYLNYGSLVVTLKGGLQLKML